MGSPVTFNGSSKYAADFQQAINRAVAFASLPLQKLQADENTINDKLNAAQSLQNVLSSVTSAIQALSSSSGSTLSSTVSNTSVLQATTSAGALPGTYTVQVTNAGSSSTAMSSNGLPKVTDPTTQDISSSSSFTLTVGSSNVTIHPAANTLDALAAAINSSGAAVQATIINVGGAQPDYRLALQATTLGAVSLQLNDGTSNLLSTLTTGTNATYTVNGQPPGGISSSSSTVTIAPGVTVTLAATGTATIQVSNGLAAVSNGLSELVNAYNSAVAELNKSRGQNGGALSGDSTVSAVTSTLRHMIDYSGSTGSIQSLTDLGIEFTQQGTLTFDPTKLSGLSSSGIADAVSFLGGASTGGFLQTATNALKGLTDATNGVVTNEINTLTSEVTADAQKIQDQQDQINLMQQNLTKQMTAADAAIAGLESQMSFLATLLSTQNANNFIGH